MKIPNAANAEIAPAKLLAYLLNPSHRRGGTKAKLLLSFGYRADDWQRLEADLRREHLTADVVEWRDTEYGRRYEIIAPVIAPNGRSLRIRSIWQVDTGTDYPRLITMYPE